MFAGGVPARQLVYYYNCASCLVLPSLYEGFGLPVLEAMACGTPVVVSNVSSLPEIVADSRTESRPGRRRWPRRGHHGMLSDEEQRQNMIRRGLDRAAEFSWERAAIETLAVYRKAAATSR